MAELLEILQKKKKVELVKRNVGTRVFTVVRILLQFQLSMKYQVNFFFFKLKKAQTSSKLGQISAIHSVPVFQCWKPRTDGTFRVV